MTMRFIPREKLGKKARRLLDRERRCEWGLSPVTRRVESKRKYSRKRKSHADDSAWDFPIESTSKKVWIALMHRTEHSFQCSISAKRTDPSLRGPLATLCSG